MPVFFMDTSAIVKRYLNETGSEWVRQTCTEHDAETGEQLHTILIAEIAYVEVAAAIAKRTMRTKEISETEARMPTACLLSTARMSREAPMPKLFFLCALSQTSDSIEKLNVQIVDHGFDSWLTLLQSQRAGTHSAAEFDYGIDCFTFPPLTIESI
ncbi:MAG: type II toxin-antitoxin system VapC family toxin [Chloroflexi bacterium]|nr:type II toxin-antitoxin system VapC family toxin [Chloroflexota bacterium]